MHCWLFILYLGHTRTSSSMPHTIVGRHKHGWSVIASSFIENTHIQGHLQIWWILWYISRLWSEAVGRRTGMGIMEAVTTATHVNNNHIPHKGVMESEGYGFPGFGTQPYHCTTHMTLGKVLILTVFKLIEYSYKVRCKHSCQCLKTRSRHLPMAVCAWKYKHPINLTSCLSVNSWHLSPVTHFQNSLLHRIP